MHLFAGTLSKDEFHKKMDRVYKYIIEHNKEHKMQGVPRFQILKNYRPKLTSKQLDEILQNLEESKLIAVIKGTLKGDYRYQPYLEKES